MSKSPPSSSLLSTIVSDADDKKVMYTDVTFKSGTPVGNRKVLYDVQEEESNIDSDWSQQSSFEDDEEKEDDKGETSKVCIATGYIMSQHSS